MIVQKQILSLSLNSNFNLKLGGKLSFIEVAYEMYGELNPKKDNVVLITTPLTLDSHVAGHYTKNDKNPGWWDQIIGVEKAIDTNQYCVIATNVLGGCQGTTGPTSIDPKTKSPYGKDFPKITIEDIVKVQRLFLTQLGIDSLNAIIGGSMGGMQALQWVTLYPDKVKKCICIATGTRISTQGLGFKTVSRKILENDSNYQNGNYYNSNKKPHKGLGFARMISIITYLSRDLMESKFGRNIRKDYKKDSSFSKGFEVESYLDYNANKFVERFDANSYLHLTYAMDSFDLIEEYGSYQKAFEKTNAEFLIISISSDWLFPTRQSKILCRELLHLGTIVSLIELDSIYGHDGFLLEMQQLANPLKNFLNNASNNMPKVMKTKYTPFNDEFSLITSMVQSQSKVLDIGCGDGKLINELYQQHSITGFGIDNNLESVINCFRLDVPAIQIDANHDLHLFKDKSFDYAIITHTVSQLKNPNWVLEEILRIAHEGIIIFPNFGHLFNRLSLWLKGQMPVNKNLPYNWWSSPNIHLFTYLDFIRFCKENQIEIVQIKAIGRTFWSKLLLLLGFKNLGGEFIISKIKKKKPAN